MTNRLTTKCFANLHMRPEEYALWNVSRGLSHESGILYFDGPEFARLFEDTGKDRIYRAAKGLTEKGWYKLLVARRRNPTTGLWMASQYRVLSVEQWAAEHPHECRYPKGTVVGKELRDGASIPQNANGHHSSKRERPFPITRTSIPQNASYSDQENLEEREETIPQNANGSQQPKPQTPSPSREDSTPTGKSVEEAKRLLEAVKETVLARNSSAQAYAKHWQAIETQIVASDWTADELIRAAGACVENLDDFASAHAGEKLCSELRPRIANLRRPRVGGPPQRSNKYDHCPQCKGEGWRDRGDGKWVRCEHKSLLETCTDRLSDIEVNLAMVGGAAALSVSGAAFGN